MEIWGSSTLDGTRAGNPRANTLLNGLEKLYSRAFNSYLYRRYDRTELTTNAHPSDSTGIDGTKYASADEVVKAWRTQRNWAKNKIAADSPPINVPIKDFTFFIHPDFTVVVGDVIVELKTRTGTATSTNILNLFQIIKNTPRFFGDVEIYQEIIAKSLGAQHV